MTKPIEEIVSEVNSLQSEFRSISYEWELFKKTLPEGDKSEWPIEILEEFGLREKELHFAAIRARDKQTEAVECASALWIEMTEDEKKNLIETSEGVRTGHLRTRGAKNIDDAVFLLGKIGRVFMRRPVFDQVWPELCSLAEKNKWVLSKTEDAASGVSFVEKKP